MSCKNNSTDLFYKIMSSKLIILYLQAELEDIKIENKIP